MFILFSNCAMYIIAPSCTLNYTLICHTVSESDFLFHFTSELKWELGGKLHGSLSVSPGFIWFKSTTPTLIYRSQAVFRPTGLRSRGSGFVNWCALLHSGSLVAYVC